MQEHCAQSHRQMEVTQLACSAHLALQGQPQALRLAQELLRLTQVEGGQLSNQAASHLASVQIACGGSEAARAVQSAKEALCMSQKSGDPSSEARDLNVLLQAYRAAGAGADEKADEIHAACQEAFQVLRALSGAQSGICEAVRLLAEVARALAVLQRPLEILEASLHLRDAVQGDPALEASVLLTISTAMLQAGRRDQCCQYAQDAARLFEEAGQARDAAEALAQLAEVQLKLGKVVAGRANARRARRRFGEICAHEDEIRLRLMVAEASLAKDENGRRQPRDAHHEARDAARLAQALGKPELVARSLATYVRVCYEVDHYDDCRQAAEELLRDSQGNQGNRLTALILGLCLELWCLESRPSDARCRALMHFKCASGIMQPKPMRSLATLPLRSSTLSGPWSWAEGEKWQRGWGPQSQVAETPACRRVVFAIPRPWCKKLSSSWNPCGRRCCSQMRPPRCCRLGSLSDLLIVERSAPAAAFFQQGKERSKQHK